MKQEIKHNRLKVTFEQITETEEEEAKMTEKKEKQEYHCKVCGRKISKEEYETYDGLCQECWDDRMTEEIDTTEGTDENFVPM